MDWMALQGRYAMPPGASARTRRLLALQKVLAGAQYDALPYPFASERSGAGEYIPLSQRRPSVRTNLCRTVVDEAVSLLFGNTHWPLAVASHESTSKAMNAFAFETDLPAFMMQVATCGAVGSVAIWVEILGSRPRFSLLETAFLTPDWDQYGALLTVTERYLVSGADLRASGYAVASDALSSRFWWQRRWTRTGMDVFVPVPAGEEGGDVLDEKRSSIHDLGFVPLVWIRNPGALSATEPDGECSFEKAIDTVIEADYLLSQAGRGLKYGSDPTLVLKTPEILEGVARQGGAASALTLPPEGDAKLLEINGAAAGAVLAHYRELRQLVLEQLHGNRTHGDRLGAPQSGRAMELMCQPLIWMADRLRGTYGDGGILPLYRMLCRFSAIMPDGLMIGGQVLRDLDPAGLSLHWPAWFAADEAELLPMAKGLGEAVNAGLLSQETAARLYACAAGVADPAAEWTKITAARAA
ncbi:phage portal protein [Asaia siamensis]